MMSSRNNMALPVPHPDLIISYSYLWFLEAAKNNREIEESVKGGLWK